MSKKRQREESLAEGLEKFLTLNSAKPAWTGSEFMSVTWSSADPLTMTVQPDENGKLVVSIWSERSSEWIRGLFSSWAILRSKLYAASRESLDNEEFASRLGIRSSEGVALWLQFIQHMSYGIPAKIQFFPRTLSGSHGWFEETFKSSQSVELLFKLWRDFASCARTCFDNAQKPSPTT